jgi:hypothetical protein
MEKEVGMFARHVTVHGSPARIDEGIRVQREHVLPVLRDCAGFKAQLFLVDRHKGEVIGISLWQTEADMVASEEKVSVVRQRVADQVRASIPPVVRIYELPVFEVS